MTDRYVGLMSGTSADGLDAVLVEFDANKPNILRHSCTPFAADMRRDMEILRAESPDEIRRYGMLDRRLADFCASAINTLVPNKQAVRAIGWAGHTVRHCPDIAAPFSLQAGDCAGIARLTGVPVVGEFRRSDLAAGGQGAPLAPLFCRAFFAATGETRAVLNLGGIANLSVLHATGGTEGFDTGPANCLMDEWIFRQRQQPFDRNGEWAAGGTSVGELLERLLQTEWLAAPPPKSTGRELFHLRWLDNILAEEAFAAPAMRRRLTPQNVQATLAAFTAHTACAALRAQVPHCDALYLSGGGAANAHLVHLIARQLADLPVSSTATVGIDPAWVEAAGIAWLAQQRMDGRSLDMRSVTGGSCRNPGVIFLAD